VLSIAPVVDAQRGAIEVKFTVTQEPPAFLREDMTLSVEVETARREQALALPLSVLRKAGGDSASVWVAVDGLVQERQLRLGLRTLAAVEVLEGLRVGDVVLTGTTFKSGQRVTVLVVPWLPSGSPAARARTRRPPRPGASRRPRSAVGPRASCSDPPARPPSPDARWQDSPTQPDRRSNRTAPTAHFYPRPASNRRRGSRCSGAGNRC